MFHHKKTKERTSKYRRIVFTFGYVLFFSERIQILPPCHLACSWDKVYPVKNMANTDTYNRSLSLDVICNYIYIYIDSYNNMICVNLMLRTCIWVGWLGWSPRFWRRRNASWIYRYINIYICRLFPRVNTIQNTRTARAAWVRTWFSRTRSLILILSILSCEIKSCVYVSIVVKITVGTRSDDVMMGFVSWVLKWRRV
jgi:hypothetical protein